MYFKKLIDKAEHLKYLSKPLIAWFILFWLFACFIFYIQVSIYSKKFANEMQKEASSVTLDLKKIYKSHIEQLKYIRSKINEANFSKKAELNRFFNSADSFFLDRTTIGTIIVTDDKFRILYTVEKDKAVSHITNRSYQEELKSDPNKIIIGKIVTGVLTKKPAIPLVAGLQDKEGTLRGSIILSILLDNLSQNLIGSSLKNLLITEEEPEKRREIYSDIISFPKSYFLSKVLFTQNENALISVRDEYSNKFITLVYGASDLRSMFLLELINYIGVLLFTFIIIAILFYNYIFKPFKPALLLIDNEQDVAIRAQDIGASLFSKIGRLIEVQSELIKRKDLQYQQQIYLASYITQIIQSRSEILTEDIDDFLEELTKYKFSSIEECKTTHFNKKLNGQDIKQFLIRNEQDIKTLLNTFRLAVEEVKICERENIDIYILLLSNDIPTEIIKKIPSNHLSLNNIESNIVNVYTGLFSHLIQEILSFEDDNRKLLEVNIGENNKLSFVFSQVEEDMEENPKLNFILSRMWGMLNNIKVKINPYNDNSLLITCEFMNS